MMVMTEGCNEPTFAAMFKWLSDGTKLLAVVIALATLIGVWMFRYESVYTNGQLHRNRITGVICFVFSECWFRSIPLN